MALNIPMPDLPGDSLLKGLDTGSNMMSRIMQPILERERLKQQQQQFAKDYALRQQARADAHQKMDPMYEINKFKALQNFLMSQGGGTATTAPIPMKPRPSNLEGEGLGVFSPQGLAAQQQAVDAANVASPANNSSMGGVNTNTLKNNPLLRGFFKKQFGFDPLGEEGTLEGPARYAADLEKLKQQFGEKSEVYQNAKANYDAQLEAKRDLQDLRARTKAGLKPGEKEFFDNETGKPVGKEVPFTAKERESEEGNIFFNEVYPYVYKGASPFSGENSITRLQQVAANYKTDPKARQLFDDYLLADKLLAATTVSEASTLKTRGTNQTYQMLKESLDAQDIPKIIKKIIKEYEIPASASLRAGMRYQKVISDARKKAHKNVPATQKFYYDPEQQAQYENQVNGEAPSTDTQKAIVVIDPNGKRFKTTEENAANMPEGWTRG